jgi:hypothetical protein
MKTIEKTPRTREFIDGISNLKILKTKPYRKIVHVNGMTAALFFYIQLSGEWVPYTGSGYYPCGPADIENLPSFIKRHIDLEKLQDYINQWAMGNSKYPTGLHFENENTIKL